MIMAHAGRIHKVFYKSMVSQNPLDQNVSSLNPKTPIIGEGVFISKHKIIINHYFYTMYDLIFFKNLPYNYLKTPSKLFSQGQEKEKYISE
jgi:hypothetical protein